MRDPLWQFGAFVLAGVSIFFALIQLQNKELTYQIASMAPLVNLDSRVQSDIQILYKGEPIPDLYMAVVRIQNTGTTPIREEDFYRPLAVYSGPDTQFLTVDVIETSPSNLNPQYITTTDEATQIVEIQPLLLNAGDSITLQLLLVQPSEGLILDTRIAGIANVRVVDGINTDPLSVRLVGVIENYWWLVLIMVMLWAAWAFVSRR